MRTRKSSVPRNVSSPGTLAEESREAVSKLLSRSDKCGFRGRKKNDKNVERHDSSSMAEDRSERNNEHDVDVRENSVNHDAEGNNGYGIEDVTMEEKVDEGTTEKREDIDDLDWEDGTIPILDAADCNILTIELGEAEDSPKRKSARRATAEEKEVAELIHKVHLLCLLGRGRVVDRACDDPLIQAVLVSLLPKELLNLSDVAKLTVKDLHPLLAWFQDSFHVRPPENENRTFRSGLEFAVETREGSSDEIAALSVALFRALGLTARFVSILDVSSLKPGEKVDGLGRDTSRSIFSTLTPMVAKHNEVSETASPIFTPKEKDIVYKTSHVALSKSEGNLRRSTRQKKSPSASELKDKQPCPILAEANHNSSEEWDTEISQGPKRKGDIEFELQMEMALSTTALGVPIIANGISEPTANNSDSNLSNLSSPLKRARRIVSEGSSSSHGVSTAIGSKRAGSPLYWAEVYCCGENLTGKWVHVDAVNGVVDGELKVEAVASACKTSLRYVVAFAGNGAKDITRRYCTQWHKIASKRVNPIWWDMVLAPLRDLESRATSGEHKLYRKIQNEQKFQNKAALPESPDPEASKVSGKNTSEESSSRSHLMAPRSALEDMELETRALTEPLPKNQQAYRTHHLYAIEKWLTKNQVLYPKGPVLGFCSGYAVYPRTSVQTLKTKERWLREALQVKLGELPVKEVKHTRKVEKVKSYVDDDHSVDNSEGTLKLFGKWQLEPLQLPHAVNGRVPKNERGQVDVWSEKCLPPGTVHLRFPRIFSVAKKLGIDYAPAMVGFEYRNGQSFPVYEGMVVCTEFKEVILEAYIEEQKQREAEEKKKNEAQAISRWYQLLSSIVTRQRISNRYGEGSSTSLASANKLSTVNESISQVTGNQGDDSKPIETEKGNKLKNKKSAPLTEPEEDHKHNFVTVDQFLDDDDCLVLVKSCHCGFSIQVEDL